MGGNFAKICCNAATPKPLANAPVLLPLPGNSINNLPAMRHNDRSWVQSETAETGKYVGFSSVQK